MCPIFYKKTLCVQLNTCVVLRCFVIITNKSAKLTQNMPVLFVVMTTFLGAGYSTLRADTAYSVFRQFKDHNSGAGGFGRL